MPNNKSNNTLIVFAKLPEPGKVKTRLARDLGEKKAARIYSAMAQDVIARVSGSEVYNTAIFFDPPGKLHEVRHWLEESVLESGRGGSVLFLPQEGDSLGQRISSAFEKMFSSGSGRVVIIGTDCLELTKDMIEETIGALTDYDSVLGPAEDGGYYLLGLSRYTPELFQKIDWSTNLVLEQTISRINYNGLTCKLLETLRDIDNLNDLNTLSGNIELTKGNPLCS